MPLYEYECEKCGKIEEALQKFSDKPLTTCRHCSGRLHKLISHSSFHLKGSGWYVTDYANKSASRPGKKPASQNASSKPEPSGSSGKAAAAPSKKTDHAGKP